MKRHPSLHALSEHHHHALVRALEIRRASETRPAERAKAFEQAARTFLRFWRKTGTRHFREEEEILLPAYARHVALNEDSAVMQMLADHAAIRGLIQDLEAALARREPVSETVVQLGRRLRDHVRLEEDQVFPCIEKTLTAEELRALGQRLHRLHRKKKRWVL